MKNKIIISILVLIFTAMFAGCSGEGSKEVSQEGTGEVSGDESKDLVAQDPVTQDLVAQESVAQDPIIDTSLEGIDLLQSISGDRPKNMKLKMDMTSYGMTTVSTIFYNGKNTRTETVTEGLGTSVLIYNANEEVMYSYVEGAGTGIRIVNADIQSAEDAGLMMDMSTKFLGLSEEISDSVIARVEKLDQEEVVYIETTQSDGEMGDVLVKMWYSIEYNMPLKYEIFMGQTPLMSLKVVEIEKDIKANISMFTVPSDINFEDINMEAMIEN